MPLLLTNNLPSQPGKFQGEYRNTGAFAALLENGSVTTWGKASSGGDSNAVSNQLNGTNDVLQIYSSSEAFAALRADGSVVTWGNPTAGGNSSTVSSQLNGNIGVKGIFSSSQSFAALRNDGSVVTWGNSATGGDSSTVSNQLNGVTDVDTITSTSTAFAALRTDGSVVTWGSTSYGGDSTTVATMLNGALDVTQIYANAYAFAALRADGSVVTWGSSTWGGDSTGVSTALSGSIDVSRIYSSLYSFAALRTDGSVITWGSTSSGGDSSSVTSKIDGTTDVVQIQASNAAFAALRSDGSVVTWGSNLSGGDSSTVATELNGSINIVKIFSNSSAFAALREDGSVITWGHSWYGGDSSGVSYRLNGHTDIIDIAATSGAFAALRSDGAVITWGDTSYGGNSNSVATLLDGTIDVVKLYSTGFAFTALRSDGSLVTWGADVSQSNVSGISHTVVGLADAGTDDRLQSDQSSTPGDDSLNGTTGNDVFTGGSGNDTINGGNGIDLATHSGYCAQFQINIGSTNVNVVDSSASEGTDTLTNIERLQFYDANLALDTSGNAGQVYRLYKAAFARTPDLGGLGGWINAMDSSVSLEQVANAFVSSDEFNSLYGADTTPADFVKLLYLNVMGRAPDAGGLGYWANQISSGLQSRAQVLANFSESAENKTAVQGQIAGGILYATSDQIAIATQGLNLTGTNANDTLYGSVAKDNFAGLAGNDNINGGANVDTAVYSGSRSAYSISTIGTGLSITGNGEGTDTLTGIERLKFSDKILAFDTSGNGGQVYRLYQAAFDRTPDTAGLSDWIRGMDNGMTLRTVAAGFIGSDEFKNKYGATPSDDAFVTLLYQNVLHRAADSDGKAYWLDELSRGMSKEMALVGFSESAENQTAIIGVIQNGIEMTLL